MIPLFIFAFGTSAFIVAGLTLITFGWMTLMEYFEVLMRGY